MLAPNANGTPPLRVLLDALDAFADVALDVDALLGTVARRTAEVVGDGSIVNLISEDGVRILPVALCLPDAELSKDYLAMLTAMPAHAGEGRAGQVIATNEALLVPEVDPEALANGTRPEWRSVARRLNVHSLLIVPMRARGVAIGAFTLLRHRPGRPFAPADRALLQELADRAGLAVSNARSHSRLKERLARTERLAEETELVRRLFDAMPQLGWTAKPDGFVDCYNQGWYDYTGTTYEEMAGWGWTAVLDPAHLPLVLAQWKESVATERPFDMAFPLRRRDGVFRWFLTRANPMRDAEGRLVRWVGINTDIDDQKRLEERLELATTETREERNRFRSLLDQLPVTVSFLSGEELLVEYAHPNTVRALGGRAIEGKPLLDAIPEHRGHPVVDRLLHVLHTGAVHEQHDMLVPLDRQGDGQLEDTYWNSVYQPVRRRDGTIEGVMTFDQETTHSSDVEQRFRLLVDSVEDYAIFMLDREGRVQTWNSGAERISGYPATEVLGRHASIFHPPEDVAVGRPADELDGALRQGRYEGESWRMRKDGSRFWARVTLTPLRERGGDLVGFVNVTRDLTERRVAEERMQALAAEKAALAEKARIQEFQERFLAILGHDLRNPLAAIDMGASVLRQRALQGTDVATIRVVDRIRSSSRRMSRMIEQILDLTRSRLAGGLEVHPRAMDLRTTLDGVVEELRAAYPTRAVEVRCPSLGGTWDPDRLEQVFSNLIGNAVGYGLPERPVAVVAGEDADTVWVDVHNDGPPIPEEIRAELFSPFRRGYRDSKAKQTAGLGLGLYISREIVLAHGGHIAVTTSAGEGTTFRVTLPRNTGFERREAR